MWKCKNNATHKSGNYSKISKNVGTQKDSGLCEATVNISLKIIKNWKNEDKSFPPQNYLKIKKSSQI